jgi:hypothetical protein
MGNSGHMGIVGNPEGCSWCSASLSGGEGKGLCADCEQELSTRQCVACDHSAEFVCVRCGDTVCLLHRTGLLHELCLCRRCSPRAVRLRPWRELGELGIAMVGITAVLSVSFGLGIAVGMGLLAVSVVAVVALRRLQNRARVALIVEVAQTPRLASARLFARSGDRWRRRKLERPRR